MKAEDLLRLLMLDGGTHLLAIDVARALHVREARESAAASAPTGVSVIPLSGGLYSRGQAGMEGFRSRLNSAVNNPDIGAIILDVDSPGGTYAGTPETAAAVGAANGVKPVCAVVDSLAASAAYWIASQAGSVVVSPSADVGSIGVLAVHMDVSKALEAFGVTPTIIRSTPFKAEGNPLEPLTAEAQASIQGDVDAAHEEFIRAVAAGRKTSLTNVRENFGQGRTIGASRAVSLGMADRIGTMSDVLAGMRGKKSYSRRSALAFA